MKRKVIQLAGRTLVVSLPSKWAKAYEVKKGDEMEVEEQEKSLILRTEGSLEFKKTILDVSNLNERVVRWALSALHKKGYDEIEVIFESKKILTIVEELIKDLFMGFAIVEQTDKRCVLRRISQDVEEEFHTALRRAFLVTISMGETSLEMIKNKQFEELKSLVNLEHTNNQLTNFCERILNKRGYKETGKLCFLYAMVWNLEKVCDDYKYICVFLSKNKNVKLSKELLDIYERVNAFFRKYYELFYKFDINKLPSLTDEKRALVKEMTDLLMKKSNEECVIINYLFGFVMKTYDFSASLIAVNQPY